MKSRAELFLILSDVFSSQNQVFHIKFLRKLGFLEQHGQIKQGPCSNRGEGSGFLPGGEQLQSKPQVQLHTRGDKRPDALTTTAWAGLDKSPGTHSREVTFHLRKLPPGNSASQTGRGKGPGEKGTEIASVSHASWEEELCPRYPQWQAGMIWVLQGEERTSIWGRWPRCSRTACPVQMQEAH